MAISYGAELGEDGLRTGERIAGIGLDMSRSGLDFSRRIADESFELADNSMGATIDTLTSVIDMDREESAKLTEQAINMVPWIVAGVVVWSVMK